MRDSKGLLALPPRGGLCRSSFLQLGRHKQGTSGERFHWIAVQQLSGYRNDRKSCFEVPAEGRVSLGYDSGSSVRYPFRCRSVVPSHPAQQSHDTQGNKQEQVHSVY